RERRTSRRRRPRPAHPASVPGRRRGSLPAEVRVGHHRRRRWRPRRGDARARRRQALGDGRVVTACDDAAAARRDAVRAARAAQTPPGPAPDRFSVVSWNVNSLKARTSGVERFLARTTPDVVAFQETRAAALVPAAAEMFDRLGLHVAYTGSGTWNGVAIVSPHALHDVVASP